MRDLTQDQYRRAMQAHGFVAQRALGYWQLPGSNKNVSDWNAPGPHYRAKLAYMLRAVEREAALADSPAVLDATARAMNEAGVLDERPRRTDVDVAR